MKLSCIRFMDFKTRYRLRATSHTERRLAEAQKFSWESVKMRSWCRRKVIRLNFGFRPKTSIYYQENQIESMIVPLLSFIFNTVKLGKFDFSWADCHEGRFPINQFVLYPMINSIKLWNLTVETIPDYERIARKWMEIDVDVGSVMFFNYYENRTTDDFISGMEDYTVVQKSPSLVRMEMKDKEKHMVLYVTYKWDKKCFIKIVSSYFPESQITDFILRN
ncbi:hypothetical protein GCK72_007610 [Caenorhabditis remanei]|uniref:F-box associated domain-containing protein n=1 Tax=Caenorhabditis remanei TaxID=31234 RepID=A0A6A5HKJ6_CAERE|nr:hypothetical protein GCK72_007610 [Caenorhabditis remanei]KAF1767651.1 hypothetical protein GCK72_007610 [Caenorhabditis remanei]